MQTPAIPEDEHERLARLYGYDLLDTPPEQAFDDLTMLAATVCGTPISLISLVDSDRQWFKSKRGLTPCQTARSVSFCGHAINDRELFLVPDATRDERFADNPLVTGDPKVAFYAGMPLTVSGGHVLGTLCVIDHVPRELQAPQLQALEALGRQAVSLIELRRHLRRAEETQAALAEASAAKDRFLATVSHELRAPLSVILGLGELLAAPRLNDAGRREYAEEIQRSGGALLSTVDRMLAMTELGESGALRLKRVALLPFLSEVLASARDQARAKGLTARLLVDPALPEELVTDPRRLRQILGALLENAVKFTQAGGVSLEVMLKGQVLRLCVQDTGPGIPSAEHEAIFERFHQRLETRDAGAAGAGLGLSVARESSRVLGAKLTVESEPGSGSRFTLEHPLGVEG